MEFKGHWSLAPGVSFDEKAQGFVYEIENLLTGRKYIGKKFLRFKGNKPSGWQAYTGSNKELNGDIAQLGKQSFKFVILKFCSTKAALTYAEAELIFSTGALLPGANYYNGWISVKYFKRAA